MKPTAVPSPTTETLAELARLRADTSVSLLVPPVAPDEGKITVRNLLKEAESRLASLGMRRTDARAVVSEAESLLDDRELWMRPLVDASVYVDEGGAVRLPGPALGAPMAVVGPRFQVKHLLDCVPDPRFAVLALSRKASHLFRGDPSKFEEITTAGLPVTMEEVLRYDDREPQLQSHGSGRRGAGGVVAAFHGQGGKREQGEDLLRYLRVVDAAVTAGLSDELLVLAGTDEMRAAYRRLTTYGRVAEGELPGSGERIAARELEEGAIPIVRTEIEAGRNGVRRRLAELAAGGQTPPDLEETLGAAIDGRIDAIVVAGDVEVWGQFDPERRSIVTNGGSVEDLVNAAAVETWRHGGAVYVVPGDEVPGPLPVAALLRY